MIVNIMTVGCLFDILELNLGSPFRRSLARVTTRTRRGHAVSNAATILVLKVKFYLGLSPPLHGWLRATP